MTDNFLIDTNGVLAALQGNVILKAFLQNKSPYLSFISDIELLSFAALTIGDEKLIVAFIEECRLIEYSSALRPIIITLRKTYGLKMADAIIAATALHLNIPLLSFDKGFGKIKELSLLELDFK